MVNIKQIVVYTIRACRYVGSLPATLSAVFQNLRILEIVALNTPRQYAACWYFSAVLTEYQARFFLRE